MRSFTDYSKLRWKSLSVTQNSSQFLFSCAYLDQNLESWSLKPTEALRSAAEEASTTKSLCNFFGVTQYVDDCNQRGLDTRPSKEIVLLKACLMNGTLLQSEVWAVTWKTILPTETRVLDLHWIFVVFTVNLHPFS